MSKKKQAQKLKSLRLAGSITSHVKSAVVKPTPIGHTKTSGANNKTELIDDLEDHEDNEDLISPEDLQTTIQVLSYLSTQPELLQSSSSSNNDQSKQSYKQLKRAGWDFHKVLSQLGTGISNNSTLQSRISHSLSLGLFKESLVLLFELWVNNQETKLGSLQRWVRECDATSRPGEVLTNEEKEERRMVLRCLDLVLRVCGHHSSAVVGGGETAGPSGISGGKGKGKERMKDWELDHGEEEGDPEEEYGEGVVKRMKVWNVREHLKRLAEEDKTSGVIQEEIGLWNLIQKGFDDTDTPKQPLTGYYPVQKTPGPLRRPPNLYTSTVWASTLPSPISFPPTSPFSITHPLLPSLTLIPNVLPASTCQQIITHSNMLGWEPDQAASGSAVEKNSVLAHNVVWLADEEFVEELFERIKPFVPGSVGKGKVRGINRRFRVYRYGKGRRSPPTCSP